MQMCNLAELTLVINLVRNTTSNPDPGHNSTWNHHPIKILIKGQLSKWNSDLSCLPSRGYPYRINNKDMQTGTRSKEVDSSRKMFNPCDKIKLYK